MQVGSTPPICKRLGDAAANGRFYIDVDNRNPRYRSRAAAGINLYYMNGDSCVSLVNNSQLIPRAVTLMFQCSDQPIIVDKGIVLENAYCGYTAIIPTRYACPTQCARRQGRVCGANGICDYDIAGGYAKCFCNKGFSGPDCSTPGDKGLPPPISYAPNLAGGFFGGLAGGMILALCAFVVKAMVRGDPRADGRPVVALRPGPGLCALRHRGLLRPGSEGSNVRAHVHGRRWRCALHASHGGQHLRLAERGVKRGGHLEGPMCIQSILQEHL